MKLIQYPINHSRTTHKIRQNDRRVFYQIKRQIRQSQSQVYWVYSRLGAKEKQSQ